MLRLEARQERLGILANPAQVEIPVLPPRDVWTRWPDLRSARRRERLREPAPDGRLARDPVLNGQKLAAFMSELRGGPQGSDSPASGAMPYSALPRTAMGLQQMRGRAGTLPALLVALGLGAGVLAWVFFGTG